MSGKRARECFIHYTSSVFWTIVQMTRERVAGLSEVITLLKFQQFKTKFDSSFGQKPCIGIILGILQSFLHFLKAKDVNSCLN